MFIWTCINVLLLFPPQLTEYYDVMYYDMYQFIDIIVSSISLQLTEYYDVIQKPMALDLLKARLQNDAPNPYLSLDDFVTDIKLVFNNCYEFNPVSY